MSKKIHDLSDEEFDDLFRQSAEKTNVDFDPEAWNQMNQMLEAAGKPSASLPGKGNRLKKWRLPVIFMLLLLISGVYFFSKTPSEAITETKVKAKENQLKNIDATGQKHVTTDKVATENKPATKTTETGTTESGTETIKTAGNKKTVDKLRKTEGKNDQKLEKRKIGQPDNRILFTEKPQTRRQPEVNRESRLSSGRKKNDAAKKTDVYLATDKQAYESFNIRKPLTSRKESVNPGKTNEAEAPVGNQNAAVQRPDMVFDSVITFKRFQWLPVHALSPVRHMADINLKLPVIDFEPAFPADLARADENTAFKRGLNIRLALSPDLSFIEANNFARIGNNWAAILEYRFNNRLSIQTGVIRSLKLYNALPYQYEWSDYFSMIQTPLKDINASCKMLDIPLNLRYDISTRASGRWFAGAGFTSYIMLKEIYRYNYENPADPNIKRQGWEGKTGAYPFSVLNLSAGYERRVFRRLTFQAEPFFKMPLGKVGYGKVRLATTGVFFSVKYPF